MNSNGVEIIDQAYQQLLKHSYTTLGVPPGTGKTIMGALLSYLMGYVTMVYCNRSTIAKQWVTTFSKCFPSAIDKIWLVGEDKEPKDIPYFIICMDGRTDMLPAHILSAIGMLIIDEAHMFCTPSRVKCLLKCQPRYIVLESATLEREDGMHLMVQSMAGTHGVFKISNQPYLVYKVKTFCYIELVQNRFGNDFGKMSKSLAESQERNKLIVSIVTTNIHRKFIILSKLQDHVKLLEDIFTKIGIKVGTLYGSKSKYSDSPVLIGTIPKIGTGFDENTACDDFQGVASDTLILCHSVKNWRLFEQLRGRCMRSKSPIVIWLADPISTIDNHFRELKSWIKETNGTIIDAHASLGIALPQN